MKSRTSMLVLEARRLQSGKRRRQVKAELHGAGLELWDDLFALASQRAIDTTGLLTLLLIHGHRQVKKAIDGLPTVQPDQA